MTTRGHFGLLMAPGDGGGGGGTDPHFASVVLLLHCDGANGSTSFPDTSPVARTITANGNAQVSTTGQKFGTGCALFDGSGDSLSGAATTDMGLGAGDFTVECWASLNTYTGSPVLVGTPGSGNWWYLYVNANGALGFNSGLGGARTSANGLAGGATMTHYAVSRASGVLYGFINGTKRIESAYAANLGTTAMAINIGRDNHWGSNHVNGRIDEIRITKGVARYTADFTPPSAAFADS